MPQRRIPRSTDCVKTAEITISWDGRRKDYLVEISSRTDRRHWYWWLRADTTAEVDEGTGWLLVQAVKEALEAQLF